MEVKSIHQFLLKMMRQKQKNCVNNSMYQKYNNGYDILIFMRSFLKRFFFQGVFGFVYFYLIFSFTGLEK